MIAILSIAALWHRREIDEYTYPVWIVAGIIWVPHGGVFYLVA